jgi:hypothetical protein
LIRSVYDSYGLAEATADTANYVDLLDTSKVKSFVSDLKVTYSKAGQYNYGIITWMKPVKITATIPLSDGTSMYTKATSSVSSDGYRTLTTKNLSAGPAEEAVVLLNNGGNWFKFQTPLTISASDIGNGKKYSLTLAFNPDHIVSAMKGVTNYALADSSNNGINVPMLDLAPIPHTTSQQVLRETYYIQFANAAYPDGVVRLELYYLKSDSAKSIYAATTTTVYINKTPTTIALPMVQKVASISSSSDGLSFYNYEPKAFISKFTRLSNVGDSGNCEFAIGYSWGDTLQATTYQLKAMTRVA